MLLVSRYVSCRLSAYCLRVTRGDTNVVCHDMCLVDLNECLLPVTRGDTNVVSVTTA